MSLHRTATRTSSIFIALLKSSFAIDKWLLQLHEFKLYCVVELVVRNRQILSEPNHILCTSFAPQNNFVEPGVIQVSKPDSRLVKLEKGYSKKGPYEDVEGVMKSGSNDEAVAEKGGCPGDGLDGCKALKLAKLVGEGAKL